MASWKKVIVSGSSAALSSLTLDNALGIAYGGTSLTSLGANNFIVGTGATTATTVGSNGTGNVVRTTGASGVVISGSFSGSFVGDGSLLTGVGASSMSVQGSTGGAVTMTLSTDTLKFTTASNHGFSFTAAKVGTFVSMSLVTPQDLSTGGSPTFTGITSNTATFNTLPTSSTSNGVIVQSGDKSLASRQIDSRVWGTSLISGSGANTRVAYFNATDGITSNANFTYNGTALTVGTSTFGTDVIIAGDLSVLGTTTQLQINNLIVEDRFILLNSGSATGDGGFIVASGSAVSGSAMGWYSTSNRWGSQASVGLGSSAVAIVPDAFVSMVVDMDNAMSDLAVYQKNGNIKITGGDIYIYS